MERESVKKNRTQIEFTVGNTYMPLQQSSGTAGPAPNDEIEKSERAKAIALSISDKVNASVPAKKI